MRAKAFKTYQKKGRQILAASLITLGLVCTFARPLQAANTKTAKKEEKNLSIHKISSGSQKVIPSLLGKNPFYISTNPSVSSLSYGILQGKTPGFSDLFYGIKGKYHHFLTAVPGLLPVNPYIVSGQQKSLHPFGIMPDDILHYTSSDPLVASVDSKGLVTGHDFGTATIACVTKDSHIYTNRIDVITEKQAASLKEEDSTLILNSDDSTLLMQKGDSYRIRVTARNKTTIDTSPKLTWTSSDSSIATVDSYGNVTAKDDGSTVITCETKNVSMTFSVNVISHGESGRSCKLSLLSGNETEKRNYVLYKQNAHNYSSYDMYLAWHGCAHCSLATVLGAYNKEYANIKPNEVISGIEKEHAPESGWQKEHVEHKLRSQMPLTLFGISRILEAGKVKNEYVPFYKEEEGKKDIINHLKTGNPVIFEVRMKSNKTKKYSKRWTNSYHTMVFLGVYTDGHHILLCDSVDRSWYKGGQRYKIVTIEDVMEFMFPCTQTPTNYYYSGEETDGGYIKIMPK